MNNNSNTNELSITTNIRFVQEGENKGKVDIDATVADAAEQARAFADNYQNRVGRVRDAVLKQWESNSTDSYGRKLDLVHLSPKTLTQMAVAALGIVPAPSAIEEYLPLVESVMLSDDRFIRINNGPKTGWHCLSKYSEEEQTKLREQAAKPAAARGRKKGSTTASA